MTAPDELDLFAPVVPLARRHQNFVRIVEHTAEADRDVLRDWARGFVDRDGKFVIEFQTTFNSSFWELYVHAVLRDAGCAIDFSFDRPDFVVRGGGLGAFVAECVIASNPADGLPEWARHGLEDVPREDLLDLAALRLAQAVLEKHRKWLDGYAPLPQCAGRPYVICVAPFEQPGGQLQGTEAIDRVLFGGPRPIFGDEDGVVRIIGHSLFDKVFKRSGAAVNLGFFRGQGLREVSAVLFSSLATWSKVAALAAPSAIEREFISVRWFENRGLVQARTSKHEYRETLVDGCHIFLNPFALHPIDPEPWKALGVGVHHHRPDGTLVEGPATFLVHRFVVRSPPAGELPWVPTAGRPHVRQLPPDGVLFGGPSRVPGVEDIEMMLYRGWTVVFGRHADGDGWQSRFRPGAFLSVEQFFTSGTEGEGASPLRPERALLIEETKRYLDRVIDGDHDEEDGAE